MEQKYFSEIAAAVKPYVPGEQPKDRRYIKLNTNENPYPPAPGVLEAVREAVQALRLYPDPESDALCEALALSHGVPREQVFVGNGSDEVLAFAYQAFFAGKKLRSTDLAYSFYPVYARLYGVDYDTVPVREDFSIDADSLCADRAVILANPNAPTSRALTAEEVERICAHCRDNGQLLLVDEAYCAFGGESVIPLIDTYDNLLVVRTFSKAHALAGLRVGYALGQPHLIDGLNRIKNSFNSYPLDRLAQAAAVAAVQDAAYFDAQVARVVATRDRVAQAMTGLGFVVMPSAANFLFAMHPQHAGKALQQALRERGILVRRFDAPRIAEWLRITIGTDEDMNKVIAELQKIL